MTLSLPGERVQMREVQAANGFSSQHDTRIHFGLGAVHRDSVTAHVRWCGGETRSYALVTNQYQILVQ